MTTQKNLWKWLYRAVLAAMLLAACYGRPFELHRKGYHVVPTVAFVP